MLFTWHCVSTACNIRVLSERERERERERESSPSCQGSVCQLSPSSVPADYEGCGERRRG